MPSVGPTAQTKAAEPGFYVTFTDIGTKPECLATITMNYPKANTFDYASLSALNEAVAKVEAKQGVRGLVLTSAIDGFFSGGFSLPVFRQISRDDFIRLWSVGKRVFRHIYSLPVPSVAAIDGHALGLGCVMAMACQKRYMVDSAKLIGLNEVAIGMPVPEWLAVRFRDLTSPRIAEDLLGVGTAMTAPHAQETGLVDSVFASRSEMEAAIWDHMQAQASVSAFAQSETLKAMRREFLHRFDESFDRDNEQFWSAISSHHTQNAIDRAMAHLAAKAKKKKAKE
ncbi:dodecenoyl-CoA isomerase [Coemansia interrupta]|uniref:Dodecenoyl-CoA isomerase n=1 Tax=Coemansia interrupta TaxID=1126814 RepID=A0A9W8HHC3_9FUNG|nr:dodecenoyl-CoA isomerase [Coemansia interrupta]